MHNRDRKEKRLDRTSKGPSTEGGEIRIVSESNTSQQDVSFTVQFEKEDSFALETKGLKARRRRRLLS